MVVHKFSAGGSVVGRNVGLKREFSLALPADARLLDVQMQGEEPQLWALVDTDAERVQRDFCWFTTGEKFDPDDGAPEPLDHVGTVQWGRFVFHLFEVVR